MAVTAALVAAACTGDSSSGPGTASPQPGGAGTDVEDETPRESYAGTVPAPAFPSGLTWFNVQRPLGIEDLRGKAVILDFWTQGCINCQHIIPDLKRLEAEFGDQLAVIGVHSGKYDEEKDNDTIRESILRNGIAHPVVNDADFLIWRSYDIRAWPSLVLLDPQGRYVGTHVGEGAYAIFQPIVGAMLEEFAASIDATPLLLAPEGASIAPTVLSYPSAVLADEAGGRLFIADSSNHRILVASLDGELQQVIGTGKEGFADGAFDEAEFRDPQGFDLSPDGRILYVADTRNHAVREVNLETGAVRTLAGTGQRMQRPPSPGTAARQQDLASPWDVLVIERTLYVSNAGSHQIFAINLDDETIEVYVGTGAEALGQGPRLTATLAQPSGLTRIGDMIYWVDPEGSAVREVNTTSGFVRNLIGTGLFDFGYSDGIGAEAMFQHPQGIVAGADGLLYVADTYNHAIRRVDPETLEVTTVAGSPERGWRDGAGREALFNEPAGIDVAGGTLYVADTSNHLIRLVEIATGAVTTLTLTNISIALGEGGPGNTLAGELPAQTVAPGIGTLRLRVQTPEEYHLNSLAPSRLTLVSSNGAVVEVSEDDLSWATDEPAFEAPIPVSLSPGEAVLTVEGTAFYCRDGEEALCFIQAVSYTLAVTVAEGAAAGEITLTVELPEV